MTPEEFDKTAFHKGMKLKYKEQTYDIISIDFESKLFGLWTHMSVGMGMFWLRCENVEVV